VLYPEGLKLKYKRVVRFRQKRINCLQWSFGESHLARSKCRRRHANVLVQRSWHARGEGMHGHTEGAHGEKRACLVDSEKEVQKLAISSG